MLLCSVEKICQILLGFLGLPRRSNSPKSSLELSASVGIFTLRLPEGHKLGYYLNKYHLYDRPLRDVAAIVGTKYSDAWFVDVGANIGDSAAAMRTGSKNRIICIEGYDPYFKFLKENAEHIGYDIFLEKSFIGHTDLATKVKVSAKKGTACLEQSSTGSDGISFVTLEQCLEKHNVDRMSLLKIDTDGMDFSILLNGERAIETHLPVCFFEYDPVSSVNGSNVSLDAVCQLVGIGYNRFVVYDNLGCFLANVETNFVKRFREFNQYLILNHRFSGGHTPYFDVCAFHGNDEDLAHKLVELEMSR